MEEQTRLELEAAAFRRLVEHLRTHPDVQNIDLMNLSGFCRNCLSKWYAAAAQERGLEVDLEAAQEMVYGMPYAEWKAQVRPRVWIRWPCSSSSPCQNRRTEQSALCLRHPSTSI